MSDLLIVPVYVVISFLNKELVIIQELRNQKAQWTDMFHFSAPKHQKLDEPKSHVALSRVQLQRSLRGRSRVCLCKAACQESTSPTRDVAAGCRFPLKSPRQDSGEALNIRCLSPPHWLINGKPPT